MDKFFKRKTISYRQPFSSQPNSDTWNCSKKNRIEINLENFCTNLGLCPKISNYHLNDRDNKRKVNDRDIYLAFDYKCVRNHQWIVTSIAKKILKYYQCHEIS